MCGIAGVVRFGAPTTIGDVEAVLRMLDAQVHRGPDDWGLLLPEQALRDAHVRGLLEHRGLDHVRTYAASREAPSAVLGSRRLSILDRSPRGRMPMGSADGRLWVTHNGEIYNYRQLRAELPADDRPLRSDSDTEMILHGYETWKEDVIQHLRGMFAFAILDLSSSSRVLLARDRFGIKPLYYHRRGDLLVFASEVRAIRSSRLVADEANPEAMLRFLELGSVPVPLTTMRHVFALPAGHSLVVDRNGARLHRYWDLSARLESSQIPILGAADGEWDGRSLLEECVELHLLSDAPLGVFLSGGIDSSALVALSGSVRKRQLTTVTLVFDEQTYTERRYARLVAERYGTDHHEILLRHDEFLAELPQVFSAMDQPTTDGVNTYFVSRAARQAGLTVALSGAGADEVFLGYRHLRRASSLERPQRLIGALPGPLRQGLLRTGIRIGELAGRRELSKLTHLEDPSSENVYLLFRGLFTRPQITKLLDGYLDGLETPRPALYSAGPGKRSLLHTFTVLEFEHYLQNQLLKDSDVMGMAHSIEIRVPYLDHQLVERTAQLPLSAKLDGGMNKPLLVKQLDDALPEEVWNRPKMGFTLPFGEWLKQQGQELRAVSLECAFLRRDAVDRVWKDFLEGRVHWSRPWALAVLGLFR